MCTPEPTQPCLSALEAKLQAAQHVSDTLQAGRHQHLVNYLRVLCGEQVPQKLFLTKIRFYSVLLLRALILSPCLMTLNEKKQEKDLPSPLSPENHHLRRLTR